MNTSVIDDPDITDTWCVTHPLSVQDRALMAQVRVLTAPNKGRLVGTSAREPFDALIAHTETPVDVIWRKDDVGGVAGWWCEPAGAPQDTAILHLHGGWFNWGSASAFRNLVGHLARSAGAKAFIPDYRLAPEHPFPAASNDVRSCYDGMLALGLRAVAISGDSAGGNLALALLGEGTQRLAGRVVGAVVLSPVTDLTLASPSWVSRAEADPFFVQAQAETLVASYLGRHDRRDPAASPLFGELAGLPPLRVHVGDDETLRDDSLDYVRRAVSSGVDAQVDLWLGMAHGFIGSIGQLEAADAALELIGQFLGDRLREA